MVDEPLGAFPRFPTGREAMETDRIGIFRRPSRFSYPPPPRDSKKSILARIDG
jgi:hypothetical protein